MISKKKKDTTICSFFLKERKYHAENLNILGKILTILNWENFAAFGIELNRPGWKLNCVISTSLQRNGVDCGCHALIIAENISRRCLNQGSDFLKISPCRVGSMFF